MFDGTNSAQKALETPKTALKNVERDPFLYEDQLEIALS